MSAQKLQLIGDSIIDNAVYVKAGQPSVRQQVEAALAEYQVVMKAVDGAVAADVAAHQIDRIGADDIVVLSAGGNDALAHIEFLDDAFETTSRKVLVGLKEVRDRFHRCYAELIAAVKTKSSRVLVLTIYNPKFSAHGMPMADELASEAALSIFNDVIQQTALAHECQVLDIRPIFGDGDDFANPIEPSAKGGAKLAAAIAERVRKM